MSAALRVSLAVALVLAFAAVPASAAPQNELDGYSVAEADTTGRLSVYFPQDVPLGQLHITVEGAGRVFGYLLQGAGINLMKEIEFGDCTQRACTVAPHINASRIVFGFEDGYVPAGTYDMYVFADGAPVRVSFAIDSMDDEVDDDDSLVVQPVESEVLTATAIVDQGENRVYSAGDFSSFERPTLSIFGMWVTSKPHLVTGFGHCTQYARTFEPVRDVALSAACPGGVKGVGDYREVKEEEDGVMWTISDQAGAMGMGGWFVTGSPPAHYGVRLLFVK